MEGFADATRDRFARFLAAYNDGDAAGLAALFTEDATFVNVAAGLARGRDEIETMHGAGFASFLRGTQISFDDVEVRSLGPDHGIGLGHWSIHPHENGSGEKFPERRGLLSFVLVKSSEGWRIAAGQNTPEGDLPRG